jgi:hypothetical protein
MPLRILNGLLLGCDSVGAEGSYSSFCFPDDLDISAWGPQISLMPVILLDC